MICPKCNGKLLTFDIIHDTTVNEDYRKKKCSSCGHVVCTMEIEVDNDETFKKEWIKYYRNKNRKKEK